MDPSRASLLPPRAAQPSSACVQLPGVAAPQTASCQLQRQDRISAITGALTKIPPSAVATGFQAPAWINAIYAHLIPAISGTPVAITLQSPDIAGLVGLLPLYVYQHNGLRIAKFADCGVSDYNALLLSDTAPASPSHLLEILKPALSGVDVLMLERMQVSPSNPLSLHPSARPSRMSGNRLTIVDTVDDFIRSLGKKFRKEAERCFRVLGSEGAWSFQRAQTPSQIANAIAVLEQQQAERLAHKGHFYELAAPQYRAFYRDILNASTNPGHIFTLSVDDEIIAVLLGITHNATFTLLRTAHGGDAWRHVSPGRLIVIEAMRYFAAQGIKSFDMGIGDYAFKRSFGAQTVPLVDLVVPITWRAFPYVASLRLKDHLRQNERLVASTRNLKSRLSALRT
jgi:CelD/BcsL family acetyltransferase involved in cellulose biosynthesis